MSLTQFETSTRGHSNASTVTLSLTAPRKLLDFNRYVGRHIHLLELLVQLVAVYEVNDLLEDVGVGDLRDGKRLTAIIEHSFAQFPKSRA